MAAASDLTSLLRAFSDATFSGFTGFPTSRAAARAAWGAAFDGYFAKVDVSVAPPSTMDRSGVRTAFCTALALLPGISAQAAATDLAGAWAAALGAVAPAPAPPPPFVWSGFTNIALQQDTLMKSLVPLFSIPGFSAADNLAAIAAAIHAATTGVLELVVQTTSGSTQTLSLQ